MIMNEEMHDKKGLQQNAKSVRFYSWLEMISIGLGVLGIGLLIAILGYVLVTFRTSPSSSVTHPSPTIQR